MKLGNSFFLLNLSASESLSAVTAIIRHLQTTNFGIYLLHRSGYQLSLSLDLRFSVLRAHNRFFFSSVLYGGNLISGLKSGIVVLLETTKPPRWEESSAARCFSIPLRQPFGYCHISESKWIYYTASKQFLVYSSSRVATSFLTLQKYEKHFSYNKNF